MRSRCSKISPRALKSSSPRRPWPCPTPSAPNTAGCSATFPSSRPRTTSSAATNRILRADFLIDDQPRNLQRFEGQGLLYTAPHNLMADRLRPREQLARSGASISPPFPRSRGCCLRSAQAPHCQAQRVSRTRARLLPRRFDTMDYDRVSLPSQGRLLRAAASSVQARALAAALALYAGEIERHWIEDHAARRLHSRPSPGLRRLPHRAAQRHPHGRIH